MVWCRRKLSPIALRKGILTHTGEKTRVPSKNLHEKAQIMTVETPKYSIADFRWGGSQFARSAPGERPISASGDAVERIHWSLPECAFRNFFLRNPEKLRKRSGENLCLENLNDILSLTTTTFINFCQLNFQRNTRWREKAGMTHIFFKSFAILSA